MKRLQLPLLCTLALSLAACTAAAATPTPAVPGVYAIGRLPDPSCVIRSTAEWAPTSISVNRFNTPTAPNTNIRTNVTSPDVVSGRIVTPLGVSVSPSTFSSGSSQLIPVTVSVSPANGPGTYTVTLYWRSSPQGSNCPDNVNTLTVTAY